MTYDNILVETRGDIKEMADKPAADLILEDFFCRWISRVAATRKPWIAAVGASRSAAAASWQ